MSHSIKHCGLKDLHAGMQVLSAAGVGGLLYWGMIFPVDVVKSAIMTDSIIPAERKYTGMISTAQVRIREKLSPLLTQCHPLVL